MARQRTIGGLLFFNGLSRRSVRPTRLPATGNSLPVPGVRRGQQAVPWHGARLPPVAISTRISAHEAAGGEVAEVSPPLGGGRGWHLVGYLTDAFPRSRLDP